MMPYVDLRKAIHTAPLTWFPALLVLVVEQCVKRNVFQPGKLEEIVFATMKKTQAAIQYDNV